MMPQGTEKTAEVLYFLRLWFLFRQCWLVEPYIRARTFSAGSGFLDHVTSSLPYYPTLS
jgi:hypothetical protein